MGNVVDVARDEVKRGVADGNMVLVDVREAHEYAAGHIPGAVSQPLSSFDPSALAAHAGQAMGLRPCPSSQRLTALKCPHPRNGTGPRLADRATGGWR